MAFGINVEVRGLDRVIAMCEAAQRDLPDMLTNVMVEEMQQAVVIARSLAPTEAEVDREEKLMLANARRAGGTGAGGAGVIWRARPIIESVEIVEIGDMYVAGGVIGAGQMAREIEFGNRWINEHSYWRLPVWEAFYRLRARILWAMMGVLKGG